MILQKNSYTILLNSCPLPCSHISEEVFSFPCHTDVTCGQPPPRYDLGMKLLLKEPHLLESYGPVPNACNLHSLCSNNYICYTDIVINNYNKYA